MRFGADQVWSGVEEVVVHGTVVVEVVVHGRRGSSCSRGDGSGTLDGLRRR